MKPSHQNPTSPPSPDATRGFVRHDCFILVAVILVAMAVVIPQAQKHGLKGALMALLVVVIALAGIMAALFAISWLIERMAEPVSGGQGAFFRGLGHLLRFLLFGLISSLLGTALAFGHGLSLIGENLVALGAGAAGGMGGCLLHQRLGPTRFWPSFGRFCLALVGSLFGGMFGILGPGNWGVSIGILLPLLIFAILAAIGRIVPPKEGVLPPPGE